MSKKIISIILLIIMLLTVTSCGKVNDDTAKIQLWYYDFNNAGYYSDAIAGIVTKAQLFCNSNNVPLEVVRYDEDTLSYDDYVLKRNTASASGNMIIIEDARYMYDLAKQHADYSKLDNYNNLINAYKDKFCIPLGVGYRALYIENEAVEYYGIAAEEPLITYGDYLEIKQEMKKKGARFELNITEFNELIAYYLNTNGLLFIDEESEIINNVDSFKEMLKKSIIEVCDDIILYNNSKLDIKSDSQRQTSSDFYIYDENSGLNLTADIMSAYGVLEHGKFGGFREDIFNKTFYIEPDVTFLSPCFYMYKKITNNKIYDLANYIVSEPTYLMATTKTPFYSPVFNGDKTREILQLDANWEYTGIYKTNADRGQEVDIRVNKLINSVFEKIVKNEDESKIIANYYLHNINYRNEISNFVKEVVNEVSNKNFDYNNDEVNKMIDEKINEFITNFNVHYN